MKKPSQQRVLCTIFSNVFEREFDSESMDDKVMLQKVVFFMHEVGVYCGDYSFSWDHYGPFSPDLSDDMKREVQDDVPVKFSENAKRLMQKMQKIFSDYSGYTQRYWVEAMASLYYMKKYMYPSYTDEEVIRELEKMKGDLGNHTENQRAMECCETLFAFK